MSNIKEQIRQKIERLKAENRNIRCQHNEKYCTGYDDAFSDLLSVIDSLPEEPSKELEEAAEEYALLFNDGTKWKDGGKYKGFIAGAEWQKEQDVRDMYMSDNRNFLKCYEQGKKDMKQQMMKDAVEGTLGYGPHLQRPIVMLEQVPDIWDGGCKSVKVIVIKEDEKL